MSKIGIALAGGGPLGGIYEVGACAALGEAIEGLDPVRADVYVGVSAGSFVAALLANGFEPKRLARILLGQDPGLSFDPSRLLRPALGEYAQRLRQLPRLLGEALLDRLRSPPRKLFESLQQLSAALPTGVFDGAGLDAVLRQLFAHTGCSNDFRQLRSQLFVVATDLDSSQAVVFGAPGRDAVPISTAVQASAALPGLFPPVRIDGRDYVDGALIKTLHASVALRQGVDLLLCINPLVPIDATGLRAPGGRPLRLTDAGLPMVLAQTFRAIIRSRMRVGMERYRHEFKNADVVVFEPAQDDEVIFLANLFSYGDRARLCEHAYQHTRADLYRRREALGPLLQRHGLSLNLDVLRDRRRTLLGHGRPRGVGAIADSVAALECALDQLQAQVGAPGVA